MLVYKLFWTCAFGIRKIHCKTTKKGMKLPKKVQIPSKTPNFYAAQKFPKNFTKAFVFRHLKWVFGPDRLTLVKTIIKVSKMKGF